MVDTLKDRCEMFVKNRDIMKNNFKWENSMMHPLCARIFTEKELEINAAKIKSCKEIDIEVTRELLKNSFVIENDDKLTIEHSTSSIIPFIKYYLEDVKVITLVLTKQVKLEDVDTMVDALYENVNINETLFIASVDFSHYLDLDQANKMDLISMDAIQNNDINKIMSFTNDNLDSPISIAAMLKMMDKAGVINKSVLNHSNSELILEKKIEETTSYITYLFIGQGDVR
ncbi:MAG: AmmeMemoRadiSam system protein B [Sedimentibacter sp.]